MTQHDLPTQAQSVGVIIVAPDHTERNNPQSQSPKPPITSTTN